MGLNLFRAPYSDASGYAGVGVCALCEKHADHRFTIDSVDLIVACEWCASLVSVSLENKAAGCCKECGHQAQTPDLDNDAAACEECVAAGRIGFTHSTAFGYVTWAGPEFYEDLEDTAPCPRPTMQLPGGGVLLSPEVTHTRVPAIEDLCAEGLRELARTPEFSSWQQPTWLFCCRKPMAFLGYWERKDFDAAAQCMTGRELAESILGERLDDRKDWGDFWAGGVCVFECNACGEQKGYWDCS